MDTNSRISVLLVMGSPRASGNTRVLLNAARQGLESVGDFDVDEFSVAESSILPCRACNACVRTKICTLNDSFSDFLHKWLKADAVLIATPVFHMSIPSQLKSLLDRLGHTMFAAYNKKLPRFMKVGAAIAQGSSRYGGQEIVLQYLTAHFLLMNCIVVSGDAPECYIGAPGYAPTWEKGSITADKTSLAAAQNLGQRLGETVRIVKAGMKASEPWLPRSYRLQQGPCWR